MAIAPVNNEAFLREVGEQVRLDTAQRFWKRWGLALIALAVAALLGFGGWLWWSADRTKKAGVAGETMSLALDALGENRVARAERELKPLATGESPGYRAAAQLALAASLLTKDDAKGAAAAYAKIAADTTLAQPFRDAATIRGVAASFDTIAPQDAINRLKSLAVAGQPWFGSAGEMTAVAYLKLNRTREAGAMFAALAKDEAVPQTIRSRAEQLASVLGVEVRQGAGKGNI